MEHYVYRIKNKINGKHYYGVRTCDGNAEDDLGKKYFSSSKIVKVEIEKFSVINFKFVIVRKFQNRKEAENFEIFLHNKFNVSSNDLFYNRANHTKSGFSTFGLKHEKNSIEKRKKTILKKDIEAFKKIGIKSGLTQKEKYKNGYKNPRTKTEILNIFDNEDKIVFKTTCYDLSKVCKEHNLPKRVLIKSYQNNGIPIYALQNPRIEEYKKFKGWYALLENSKRIDVDAYLENGFKNRHNNSFIKDEHEYFVIESILNNKSISFILKTLGFNSFCHSIFHSFLNRKKLSFLLGEKHSASKVKTIAAVDTEKIQNIKDFVESTVTHNRCMQSVQKLKEAGKPLTRQSVGDYLRWIINDVMKEELDTMVNNGIEPKSVNSAISNHARQWFFMNEINFDEWFGM